MSLLCSCKYELIFPPCTHTPAHKTNNPCFWLPPDFVLMQSAPSYFLFRCWQDVLHTYPISCGDNAWYWAFIRVRTTAKSGYKLRHVYLSVRMEQPVSHQTDFHEIWYLRVFRKYFEKIQVSFFKKTDKITCNLRKNLRALVIISRWILLRMKNVSKVAVKIKAYILCSLFTENSAVYEVMWINIVEPYRPQMTIWRMRIACWIPKATNTCSEYAILIAFPLQKWLHESASVLRYTYIAWLVNRVRKIAKKRL
jgi:hypothetical protein